MQVELWSLDEGDRRRLLKTVRTNADGRVDEPLIQGADILAGSYELVFSVSAYFAQTNLPTSTPPFLDPVLVRFGIADPDAHYHVPLLVSPWAYSTYRGS